MQRRVPLLLACALALMFSASIVRPAGAAEDFGTGPREPTGVVWNTLTVSIADDFPIRLSPRINFLPAPRGNERFYCLNAFRALESESVTFSSRIQVSSEPDDWRRLRLRAANAVAHAELRSITGPAKIREDGLWTWLEVSDGKTHFKTSWVRPRVQLIPGQTYTFAVLFAPSTEPVVEKVFEEGRIIFDLSVCEVHAVQMSREEVPIIYGSGGPGNYYPRTRGAEPSFETMMQSFPHHLEVLYGGCVPFEPTTMFYICPQCRAAFVQWEQEHRIQY